MEVDIKGIQDLLGVSGKITPSKESTHKVVYKGEKLLVFGFQSISFSIEGKDKEEPKFKLTPAKKTVVLKGKESRESDQARNVLFTRHELLEMNFQD